MLKKFLLTAAVSAALTAAIAQPASAGYAAAGLGFTNGTVTSGGMLLTPGGDLLLSGTTLNALYLFNDAANTDSLSLSGATGSNCGGAIFANHTNLGCTDSVPGTTATISGLSNGQALDFVLHDLSTSANYASSASSATTHFAYDATNIASVAEHDLNLPAGSLTGNASLVAALLAMGPNTVVVAVEDLALGLPTEDYNDLVFAFSPVSRPARVPEPVTLSLFGAGLLGVAGASRRKKKK
jgi:hypothetical protein